MEDIRNRKNEESAAPGRSSPKAIEIAISVIAVLMVLYHLSATQYLFLPYDLHKNLHLAFGLILVFLSLIGSDLTNKNSRVICPQNPESKSRVPRSVSR